MELQKRNWERGHAAVRTRRMEKTGRVQTALPQFNSQIAGRITELTWKLTSANEAVLGLIVNDFAMSIFG